ncbi:hypothetical protein BsWGS_23382 [Bradybaena similaris]
MSWLCCWRPKDTTESCDKKPCRKRRSTGRKDSEKHVSFTASTTAMKVDDPYIAVREYDQRQIRMSDAAKTNPHLARPVYYPTFERRLSRLAVEEQRAEAMRLQSVGKQPPQARRQSLLETSQDQGPTIQRQSIQQQNLYAELKKKPK